MLPILQGDPPAPTPVPLFQGNPPQDPQRTIAAETSPFATAPDDAIIHVLSFFDLSANLLHNFAATSSRCRALVLQALRENAADIRTQCSQNSFYLYRSIASLPERDPLLFHRSVVDLIRSYHLDCPDRILSSVEVGSFRDQVQVANEASLEKIWPSVHEDLVRILQHPQYEEPAAQIPALLNAKGSEIGAWMQAHTALLEQMFMLSLNNLRLTCVPWETSLFTGLEHLHFNGNLLTSFPPNLLHRCGRLCSLGLVRNSLSSLSPLTLNGLEGLTTLYLSDNPLCSLPPTLFNSTPNLKTLYLNNTRLRSLSPVLFAGLNQLNEIQTDADELLFSQHLPVDRSSTFYSMGVLERMEAFFNYRCRSPFAQFYQFVAGDPPPEAVRESFSRLHNTIKQAFFRMAWDGFHFPDPAYYQWGIERLCNDRELLHTLLKRVVSLSGLRLSANASLLLSHRDSITRLNYPEFFKAQLAFYTPASKIGFLQFYQLATSTASPRSVMESFTKLDDALKRLLVSMLWNEFHRDADYCRWGEAHLFDDMQSFRHFLMRFVNERQVCDLPGETILERIDSIDFELPEPHPQQAPAPPPPPVQANWGTARLSGRLLPGCLLQ